MSTAFLESLNRHLSSTKNPPLTANGAVAVELGDDLIELFQLLSDKSDPKESKLPLLAKILKSKNKKEIVRAIKALFYARDIRFGSGIKKDFRDIIKIYPDIFAKNIELVAEVGSFKDVFLVLRHKLSKRLYDKVVAFIKTSLENPEKRPLVAKYLPRRVSRKNRNTPEANADNLIAISLQKALNLSQAEYRKLKMTTLETLMSSGQWNKIDLSKIPSTARNFYSKSLSKKIPSEKWEKWKEGITDTAKLVSSAKKSYATRGIGDFETKGMMTYSPTNVITQEAINVISEATKQGKAKINVGATNPVAVYSLLSPEERKAAWNSLPWGLGNSEKNSKCLVMVDTSGSMDTSTKNSPLKVAVAMALYASHSLKGPFKDNALCFSSKPYYINFSKHYDTDDLVDVAEVFKELREINDCSNTDLNAAFKAILNTAVTNNLTQADLPEYLVVFTDLQFDPSPTNRSTAWETYTEDFKKKGYIPPTVIWWTLNSSARLENMSSYPSKASDKSSIIINGVNMDLLQEILFNGISSDMSARSFICRKLDSLYPTLVV